MPVPRKHILSQAPVIAALGRSALFALAQRVDGGSNAPAVVPGPELRATLAPRPTDLVRDAVRWAGGDPRAYRDALPTWLFPQWSFPLLTRTLEGLPYPMMRALNGGCTVHNLRPIPAGEPLKLSAQLVRVDDDGRRAILHQRLVTGTASVAEAQIVEFQVIIPLAKGGDGKRSSERPRVPDTARELARWRLSAKAGLDFAILTGDFNPIHWVAPAARAAGFRNTILHGFASLARAVEGLQKSVFAGDTERIEQISVRFVRPLVLPARVGLYVDGKGGVTVGDAPGGPAYMTGTFIERGQR
ncbi:MAG: MaoC/PaaZ C-terminal domain-containing protein [Myxococcota bacterium]